MHFDRYRKVLVQVFGSLKQRVLWKWDKDTMEDLPPNVRLGKWLPQQDILGKIVMLEGHQSQDTISISLNGHILNVCPANFTHPMCHMGVDLYLYLQWLISSQMDMDKLKND